MDTLGKLIDIFVFLVILFMIPAGWALSESEAMDDAILYNRLEEYLDTIEYNALITGEDINAVNSSLSRSGPMSVEIEIIRRDYGVITMNEILEEKGGFKLRNKDIVTIKVKERGAFVFKGSRAISW